MREQNIDRGEGKAKSESAKDDRFPFAEQKDQIAKLQVRLLLELCHRISGSDWYES
jgi:hypothetical protein